MYDRKLAVHDGRLPLPIKRACRGLNGMDIATGMLTEQWYGIQAGLAADGQPAWY